MALRLNCRVYDIMPCTFFYDSFNDIHELKCGQAEEKLEAGGDEKLIFNFIWPQGKLLRVFDKFNILQERVPGCSCIFEMGPNEWYVQFQ